MALIKKSFKDSRFNILNLLRVFNFGNKTISEYDTTKVYNTGDFIYVYTKETHDIKIFKCTEDGVTGAFNASKWTESSVSTAGGSVEMSETEPTSDVHVWYRPIETSEHRLPE